MIITGGENVSPVEIESCLSLHPAVSEVAVVGLADERWGKIVAAFVKRRAAVTPEDLDQHSAARPASPTSSARAAMCSSRRFRNRRSASCCAASWSPANTRRNVELSSRASKRRPDPARNSHESQSTVFTGSRLALAIRDPRLRRNCMTMTFTDPRLATLDGFRVEIDAARARRRHPRPAAVQHRVDAAARPASASCSRRSTRMRACA